MGGRLLGPGLLDTVPPILAVEVDTQTNPLVRMIEAGIRSLLKEMGL
jgi:hypothetical protein